MSISRLSRTGTAMEKKVQKAGRGGYLQKMSMAVADLFSLKRIEEKKEKEISFTVCWNGTRGVRAWERLANSHNWHLLGSSGTIP